VDLEAAWKVLAGDDASRAYEAIFQFALVPERAVPFLAQHVRPVALLSPEDRKHHAQLITNLDSPRFRVRAQAAQELEKLEDVVLPVLRQALEGKLSAEARRRIDHLLARYEGPNPSPQQLRQLRALQALERIATPAARDLLADLAGGASEARLTREAKESLERLDKRH
jgi:hypothetical protein